MMLFRQHSLVLAAFALLALLAHQETGVMVSAQVEDKDDNKDKDDVEDDDVMEPPVMDGPGMDGPGMDGPGMDGPGMAEQVVTEISDIITDFIDELPTSDDNATVTVDTEDMECTCDKKNTITCMNVEDEEACMCEDGDVVCVEDVGPEVVVTGGDVFQPATANTNVGDVVGNVNITIVEAPTSAMDTNANPEPDSQMASSASAASSMISMAISAAGIAAVALN